MFVTATAEAQIRYVDKSAVGLNNGSTWANAYTTIQPAIDAMFAAGGGQVWVAGAPGGLVYNEARTELWGGPTAYAGSLVMKDNVAVFGGFEGWRGGTGLQETALSQRAPGVNVTVINGATSRAGSPAYHVVVFGKGAAPTVGSRLDGFQITGGNAAGVSGVYHAYRGGGIYNWRSNPVIANCRVYGNTASVSGGGVANEGISGDAAAAQYINCVIDGNTATRNLDWQTNPARGGGGMFINISTPQVIHCTITANTVGLGAAVPGNPNHGLTSGGIFNVTVGTLPATAGSVLSTISYGNTGNVGIVNAAITGAVKNLTCTYSDIDGGLYPGTGNINALPNFSGAAPFPYQITGAPCVNTGSSAITEDIRLVPRPLGGARDMGAYEYSTNGPSAVCANYTVNLNASCAATMTAANINGGSVAEAGIVKLTASQTTFGSADIPSKTVTLTVLDRFGRTATCNATVTVNDPIAPVITSCPPNQNVNANASCAAPAPNLAALTTATDNCGIASITQVPAAGTLLPLGPTPIQITVTDVGGNAVLTCAPIVTVVDVTLPVITTCPPSQNVATDPSCNITIPNFLPTGAWSDNCGIASVVQAPAAGTVLTGTQTVTITVQDTSGNLATCQTQAVANDMQNPVAVCMNTTVNLSSPTIAGTAIDGGSTDNCGIAQRLIDGAATRTFTCANIPSATAVLTVRDGNGNAASCNATVTVVDDVDPVAVCQNITVNLSAPTIGAAAIDGGSSDNCAITNRLIDGAPNKTFTCADLGPNTVTLLVGDAAGNTATCNATVTVVDDINPTAVCQDITVQLSAPTVAAAAIDGGSTDNCGTIAGLLINGAATHTFTCADRPSTTAVLTVSDPTGNTATCNATVTVVDDVKPIITRLGTGPITVECGGSYADAGATASDNCDGDITATIVTNNPVNVNLVGNYTVTYNVNDAAGNAATQVTRQVNVVDTTKPIITLNGANPMTVECGGTYTELGATASDVCYGDLTASISINGTVNTALVGVYSITYDVTDGAGNSAVQVTRTVNVTDTTKPVITLNGTTPVTVECGSTYTDAGATASDVCDGTLTTSIVTNNPVNAGAVGTYTVTYNVTDTQGNNATQVTRTVNVVDSLAPVIARLGDSIVTVELGGSYTDAGATAADQCDGDLTTSIVTNNPVNTSVVGTYTVTYDVTDAQGNAATQVTRTVYVVDTARPYVLSVAVQTGWTVDVTFSKDNMSSSALTASNYVVSGSGQGTLAPSPQSVALVSGGTYRLTWPGTQEMFNGGDITITVNDAVQDVYGNLIDTPKAQTDDGGAIGVAPVITMNGSDETLECGVDIFSEAGASATDNVDGTVAVVIGGDTVDDGIVGVYTITYTSVDAAGNETVESRTVTVEDTAAPVITMNGGDETVECGDTYTDAGASADDDCDGALTVVVNNPVNDNVVGVYTVTYNVTDGEGNAATEVTRTVTVQDTLKPVITRLGQEFVYVPLFESYTDSGATAADQCDGNLTASIIVVNPVDTNTPGSYLVTYNVTDAEGNVADQVTRTVIVLDTQQPTISSVTVESELTVLVQYSKDMTGGYGMDDVNNYAVSGSGIGTFGPNPVSVEMVSGTVYRLTWARPDEMFNGGDITITVDPNIEDSAGNFMGMPNFGTDFGGAIGEAPVITLNGSDELLECGVDTFVEAGATAEDNVDGTVTVAVTGDDLVNDALPGVYVVEYDAVDAAGNAAYASRTITVEDNAVPEIELVGASALQLECNLENYEEYGASAWDACAGDLTSEIVTGAPANTGVLGLQIVTYSVTDTEGNSASVDREVTVVDTTAPSIALLGANPVVLADGSDYVEAGAEAFDECEGDLSAAIVIDGDVANTSEVATYVLTYTVSDSSANEAAASRTVVVKPEDCELAYSLSVDVNPVTPGGTATFTAAPLPENCSAGDIHYLWMKDGEVIPDAPDAATYAVTDAEFANAGNYKCAVSDASSSTETNVVSLIVTSGVPAAGAFGLLLAAAASALAGVAALRKRR